MRSRAAILYEYGSPWTVEEFDLDPPRTGEVLLQLRRRRRGHQGARISGVITKRYRLDEINESYAAKAAGELIRGVIDFGVTRA